MHQLPASQEDFRLSLNPCSILMSINASSIIQNKDLPLVSVVICTYNGERFLREQLDSLLAQTYPLLEFIVSDDHSTDQTPAILEEYAKKDSRFRIFIHKENLGPNKNFERAIQLANGKYVAICDQDDHWAPEKISRLMEAWRPETNFIFCLSGKMDERGVDLKRPAPAVFYSDIDKLHTLVFNTPVNGHACIIKKEFAISCMPFPADIYYDWWMSMFAASEGVIQCLPQTLCWQRMHGNNFSHQVHNLQDQHEKNKIKRKEWSYFIMQFFARHQGPATERLSLLKYAELLNQMDGQHFSWPMFFYILKHRKLVFHYKRKPFVFISHFKHALRMAKTGVL